MQKVALINYGSGNLRSAEKALLRAAGGASEIVVTDDPDVIASADRILLPGVGAFAACMGALEARPGVIEAMTGHVQYAQAAGTAAAAAAKVVGHVVKMTGSASVVRNGVTIALNNGDTVLQNDVVQTGSGSSLGLVMIDGTTFNLSAGARLMLNDLTYDTASTSNSSLFTLVQGAASFVAGQVAKTGDMKVGTPVATMGIRGTAVQVNISSTDGTVKLSVMVEPNG